MAQDFARAFYNSKAWRDLRFALIIERGPKCQKCGQIVIDTSKLIGHHRTPLTPLNINNPAITLNPENIDIICFDCHNLEPSHFSGGNRHAVYLVYGSPLSGKTTLVSQLAERGDIILDIDRLYQCISGLALYDKPDNLRFNVFALRDKMLDMIKTRYGSWHDAYIIGGYPVKSDRERLARDLGAELIYCESSREECYARAATMQGDWRRWVAKWWAEYTA